MITKSRVTKNCRIWPQHRRSGGKRLFPEEDYGFIVVDNGTEVYFHRNAVHDFEFEKMDGMEVTLNIEPGEKARRLRP